MVTQRTVLVVASSEKDDTTYQQQLQQDRGMDYNIVLGRSSTLLPALSQSTVKLDGILFELESPYNRSFQLLRQLKEQTSAPVIVIDGGDTEVAVQAFKHGAADYLVKDRATPDDLRLAMRTAIENAELKRELQRSQETFYTSVENMLDCFGIFSAMRDNLGQIVDFRIDYLNAAACENNQMPQAMQIGRGLCEVLPAHRESGLFDDYCQLVETGEPLIKESLVYDDTYGDRHLVRAFDIRATKLNDGFVASWRDVTDRKRWELEQQQTTLELQKSQERLNLAMKAASMGSWDWNIQTGEVNWSTSLEHLFGMAPGSFDGRYETVRAMIHPEDLPRVEQALQRALYDREEYSIEFRFFKPDGTVRWALSLGHVVYDDDGNPVMMAGVDRDITTRKQAEVALRNSEHRYRSLVEATALIIWNTEGNQGEFTTEQPSWSAFTGQTFEALKGWGWLNAVHPEDRAKTTQVCFTAIEAQTPCEVEYRLRRQDGVYRHMQVRAVPIFDDNGTLVEWLGVHTDVTESEQAAAVLADNEARLRGFVEANVVGILYGDIYGNIHAANDELLRIVGYTQEEVRAGRLRWVEITPPEYLPLDEQGIAEARARGACTPYEKEYIRKDGSRVPVLIGYSLVGEAREEAVVFILDLSDRKQVEQALRNSEERFRQLAENIDAVFWIKEVADNRFSYISPAFERLWGVPSSVILNTPEVWLNYIHPDDRAAVVQAFQSNDMAALFDREYRIVLPDGTIRWLRSRCCPLYDSTGTLHRLAGISEDITEQKQTNAALLENEKLLRLALAGAKAGSWDWNLQTNDVTWSPENYDLYGISTANEVNWYRLWYNTIHPDDRERVRLEILRTIEQRHVEFQIEFRIVHPQRGLRWLLGRGRFTLNEQGEPIRLSGINLDITARKQTEEDLRQSEEFKNRLLESSLDCIKVLNLEGRLLYMNVGGMCIMEIDDLTPYLNQEWVCFWGEEFRPLAEQALETAKAGEVSIFRGFCPTAKGTPKYWEVIVSPIRGASGQTEQVLSVSRDISDRRQAEVERSHLLQQEQAARAEAERANRIKDEFLAILSHELRSPLNPILGWTKLLQSRKFDAAKTAEALAIIERNAKLQTQLIDDLLDIAKILRGKLAIEMAAVDLAFVIESAIDTVRSAAIAKSIRLHSVLPQIGRISGDSARLQQIVWNLLSNAIKFTPKHGQVEILLERVGAQAQIKVSDTGKGINPEFLPYLFESFRQEDTSTTRKYGGLGLGLAIVRSLVEAHGGSLTADSPGEGQGATFTVRFPLIDLELEQPSEQLPVPNLDLMGVRVLAVDDEADARELLAVVLTMYGAEVLTVTSATEVLTTLVSFQPDVLVSDIGMPDVDGYSLIQQIRALPPEQGGRIPAIALTAYAREEDYQRAIVSGFQQQVTKPLEPEQLVQAVVVLVGERFFSGEMAQK
ncbi:PAS domain-containing protein [Desertifilum sp. FACHB-1129]|uniref:PAS domain-containing protein n=1 Tax=unclassified Desertifilum TaxID=2621682 RepID=UPI0016853707|nr:MULTISPECIES: PAS domain-containing protein [unclassified Desertifilum]MBD2311077.1 PAS domain-containing protein [Desertifilum sp. FACHB-1129]MBD2323944.1 PAS domain-containing protein [Desertifilum sp. FACHB-866]MBD2333879.1 PAS domain-containing protein [Desertifilum sp. FACHB-868]MDA0211189.1 PAS domain-containing protein [Cyanobacteria bacterium FC1]